MRHCENCGGELHPGNAQAARRMKFCSQRCRRAKYAGRCLDCGAATDGSAGPGKAPRYCFACTNRRQVKWTRETVVAAIHRFAERYGSAPRSTDFNPALAAWQGSPSAALKRERFYGDGDYPTTTSVCDVFGTWNAAIRAAGFEPFSHDRDHDWRPGQPREIAA